MGSEAKSNRIGCIIGLVVKLAIGTAASGRQPKLVPFAQATPHVNRE
jgi:hypothetical protein